jgi:hypothetical protein
MAEVATIGSFKRKLSKLVGGQFPGAKVSLDQAKPAEKVGGMIVWDGFEGMEQVDRQNRLWKVLRANLSRDEQLMITAILTMSPSER